MDWNNFKNQAETWIDKAKEKANETNEFRKKSAQETKIKLTYKTLVQNKKTVVRKDIDGNYYISPFYNEEEPRFNFENLEFNGSTIIEKTTGNIKKQSRLGSALAGGALLGGVGTIAGASRKRKDKVNTKTTQEEKPGKGILYLRNKTTNEIKTIKFTATQSETENIVRFFR